MSNDVELLSVREVCRLLKITKPTLLSLVALGKFPEPFRLSARTTRWRKEAIANFLLREAGNGAK